VKNNKTKFKKSSIQNQVTSITHQESLIRYLSSQESLSLVELKMQLLLKRFISIFFLLFSIFLLQPISLSAQNLRVGPIKVNANNARNYRDSLVLRVFGSLALPYQWMPDSVQTNVNSIDYFNGFPYTNIRHPSGNLSSVDKLVVSIDANLTNFPTKAKIYLFHPYQSNGKLFIYHSGHCAGTAVAEDVLVNGSIGPQGQVIPQLIAEGYTVLAVPMIFYRNFPRTGYVCGYNGHDQLFIDNQYARPLSLFFKPLIAALNFLGRANFNDIYLMGLSGGGWVASVYPAMDSSIRVSIPVAGSWPMALRTMFYNGGDFEQTYTPVFRNLLDYHELYTLSCLAPPRKMLQINNRYDACCYNGAAQHLYYVDSVTRSLEQTGGQFQFYLDETQGIHAIAPRSMNVIRSFIQGNHAALQTDPPDSTYAGMSYYYDVNRNFILDPRLVRLPLNYSVLKAPEWMYLNYNTGEIHGQALPNSFIPNTDTLSFKAEDSLGRFFIKSLKIIKKRSRPYFFTIGNDSTVLYGLPFYTQSLTRVDSLSANHFFFNRNGIQVQRIGIVNNSILRLQLNNPLIPTDSIGYNGMYGSHPIRYVNNERMDNFGLTNILLNAATDRYAVQGMIRFNSETRKFEYFNGARWVEMH
jgi:hypothetical protein